VGGRIAVAGAPGTIGSELVRLLVAAGADVRALVRDPDRPARSLADLVAEDPGRWDATGR
jgi:uncharacterized protein YbjT (DUF2867 family)